MPFYDYYSEETGEEREVFHGMNEKPQILDSEGNEMKKAIKLGHGGFKLIKDSTRRRDYGTRYGGKKRKSDHTPTPSESADAKAAAIVAEKKAKKNNSNDPYASFR